MALQNTINRHRNGVAQIDPLKRFNLSPRESRIATDLQQGTGIKVIAHKAGLAVGTVRTHQKAVYKKLGIHSRPDFMRLLQGAILSTSRDYASGGVN